MEAEPVELEDGEVVDDEPDVFEPYKVLQRPHTVPRVVEPVKMGCSDESDESDQESESQSDSDSDSHAVYIKNKRPKMKLRRCKKSQNSHAKNDKYKVWCTQVQEESLTEDLISCGVTNNLYKERSVETYNFTMRHPLKNTEISHNNSSDDEREVERRYTNKRTNADRHNVKIRLGKRRDNTETDSHKGDSRIISDLSTTVESSDADVASDIAEKLNEKKDLLIRRIVDIIGKEGAMDFFQKTKKIEEEGGMLIMNGSRRRTAGGVYLYLVKNDEHIPQEKIREIFYQDRKDHVVQRKKDAADIRRQKAQDLIKNIENGPEKDLPALLTRAELSTKQIAEEARFRRGEGMDRLPVDSERIFSNPPPSPVTDDPDHTENSVGQRQVQDYGDDFLDLGVDVDSMEVL